MLDGTRVALIAAQPGWMRFGSAAISGAIVNALWLVIALLETKTFPHAPAVYALAFGGPALVAAYQWFALGAFARGPSAASRRAVLGGYALAASFFIACALVQIFVLERHARRPLGSWPTRLDTTTIVVSLIPSIALVFAAAGLLRTNVEQLARNGYRTGDP